MNKIKKPKKVMRTCKVCHEKYNINGFKTCSYKCYVTWSKYQ